MRELYEPFVRTGDPDPRRWTTPSAEMTKYAANALLATRISFMNEIANLCERVGADVDHVRRGIGSDRRIGHHFLFPGVGYGGSCFPKDVQAVIHTAHEHGMKFPLLNAVEEVNDAQKQRLVEKVVDGVRREPARAGASRSGASPSSRGPTTCARRRRSPSSRGCSRGAPRSRCTIPRRSARRGRSSATASPTTA